MILGEKSERRDQNSFSFLENINFWKSLPRAPEFEYPTLCTKDSLRRRVRYTFFQVWQVKL